MRKRLGRSVAQRGLWLVSPVAGALACAALFPVAVSAAEPPSSPSQLAIVISSDRGPTPIYRVGEGLTVVVRTSQAANLYCFYQQGDGKVIRIFPNSFRPSAAVKAETPVSIPDSSMQFRFRFDHPLVSEAIRCFATPLEAPVELGASLSPDQVPLSLSDLSAVNAAIRQAAGSTAQQAVATMSIAVSDASPQGRR